MLKTGRHLALLVVLALLLVVSACSGAASDSTESLPSTTLVTTSTAVSSETCFIVNRFEDWTDLWYNYMDSLHIREIADPKEKDEAFLEWRNTFSSLLVLHVLGLDQIVEAAAAADVAGENDATPVLEYVVVVRSQANWFLTADSLQQLDLDDAAEFRK